MESLEQTVIQLRQKKKEATQSKQNAEDELRKLQSIEKRSSTGLHNVDKKIESEKEDVSDVSDNLTRKTAQVESIERLVSVAEERVIGEKELIDQTEQQIEFAETPEEKQSAEARLRSLNGHLQELISEIKNRQKTLKKITGEVSTFDDIKSKITIQIKKQTQSKPSLRTTLSTSHKTAVKVIKDIERITKSEENITKTLDKATSKLKEYLAKKTAAKRKPAKKTIAKRKPAKKTAAKRKPAKKTIAKRKPAKKTAAKKKTSKENYC